MNTVQQFLFTQDLEQKVLIYKVKLEKLEESHANGFLSFDSYNLMHTEYTSKLKMVEWIIEDFYFRLNQK